MSVATRRRLLDELNVDADLEYAYKFVYRAEFRDLGSEYEHCHVYLGRVSHDVSPNDHEISELRFSTTGELEAALAANPDDFTPWFRLEWQALREQHAGLLSRYAL